jgi:hypothetical protein
MAVVRTVNAYRDSWHPQIIAFSSVSPRHAGLSSTMIVRWASRRQGTLVILGRRT